MSQKPVRWTLDVVRTLIADELQPESRRYGYHVALGGSVLNTGLSRKDLDLYYLPLDGVPQDRNGLKVALSNRFGGYEDVYQYREEQPVNVCYEHLWRFKNGGHVVEVFVIGQFKDSSRPVPAGTLDDFINDPNILD